MASPHFTYLIWSGAEGLTKIGHSANVNARLSSLATANGSPLQLAHTWRGDRETQVRLERDLHRTLAWARSGGEWFRLAPSDIIGIGDALAAGRQHDASVIALELRCAVEALAAYEKLSRQKSDLHPRWNADERQQVAADVPVALAAYGAARLRYIAAGGLPNEAEKSRSRRAERRLERPIIPAVPYYERLAARARA